MVKYFKYIVIAASIIVIAIIAFSFFEDPSPEKQIEKQVIKFLYNASKSSGDKLTTALLKSRAIEGLFAPHCSFHVGVPSFSGRYTPIQISANSMRCRSMFKYIKFSAHDMQVKLTSPSTATVDFTGSLSALSKRGKSIENYKELSCNLQLIEGEWLISAVSVREIIKK